MEGKRKTYQHSGKRKFLHVSNDQNQPDPEKAFDQVAEYAASTSATNVPCDIFIQQNQAHPESIFDQVASASADKVPYDVFINHRGEVKHTLASTIYHTLNLLGVRAFFDKEALELGDVIPAEIRQAMASASLHIAIFSPSYAESRWCLDELSFMLKTRTKILPIFYKVQPSHLRWIDQGKGVYAHAFAVHEKKGTYSLEKLDEWRKALNEISIHSGYITVNDNEDEGMRLKTIVNRVRELLGNKRVPLEVAKHPVGMDELVQDFERAALESVQSQQIVKMVGIVGMGGSGKTTLAKELFNRKSSSFDRCSFISDVRDAAARHALNTKQENLLKDLRVHFSPFNNIDQGKECLKQHLRSVRALIVLDDVADIDQLDSLLPNISSLRSDSLVIVTTRELGVLKSLDTVSMYKMPGLKGLHAEQLFCWHAFLQSNPPSEFKNLVEKFLEVCNGLPLSLKVFGGQLYGQKCKQYWESTLHKISRKMHLNIKQRLQISYDALDEEDREIFLDIACFFIGEEISLAIAVWDGSGWSGLHSWQTLLNKCLVELDDRNRISMHDHLRDMGREIAAAHEPHRFWMSKQIVNIATHSQVSMHLRGIADFAYSNFLKLMKQNVGNSSRAFKCLGLKILFVQKHEFSEDIASLSEDLVWLRWYSFQDQNLPSWLSLINLSALEVFVEGDLEELWEDNVKPPLKLIVLRIIDCGGRLRKFPNSIGRLKHLKKISCTDGFRGSSLPEEFCGLKSLEHLELPGSEMLSSLPAGFGELISLRHIDLSFGEQLRMLPDSFKNLVNLEYLDLNGCRNLNFKLDMLENITKLEFLNLHSCEKLEELPHQIINQGSLRELRISHCINLRDVPDNIGRLCELETMRIGSPLLTSLPCSLGNLSSLTTLKICKCEKLERLPHTMGRLNLLRKLNIWKSAVRELPCGAGSSSTISNLNELMRDTPIRKICCPAPQTQSLVANAHIMEICTLPTSLNSICLQECKMLKNIKSVGGLQNLRRLIIDDCPELDELPSFADLASLEVLYMQGCPKVEKIEGLEHCRSLRELRAYTCWKVSGIQSLMNLESLKEVELTCDSISALKPCVQSMKECPRRVWIRGRVVRFVKPIVKYFEFPDVTVVWLENSSEWHNFRELWRNTESEYHFSHWSKSPFLLYIEEKSESENDEAQTRLTAGKVVGIYVSPHDSSGFFSSMRYQIFYGNCERKAMLVRGGGGRVWEAFYQLLELLE